MRFFSFLLISSIVAFGAAQIIEEPLLEEIEETAFLFFWEQTDPATGQVKDRAYTEGIDARRVSSIAATGFGLAGLAIAHERQYMNQALIEERVLNTLRYVRYNLTNVNGWYYHFVDMTTGERQWECELSSIDTALLMGGVLTVGEYFKNNSEIVRISKELYERIDFVWMMNSTPFLTMGWKPESGFLDAWWDRYCELMILLIMAIGSPTHPIPLEAWNAFSRPLYTYNSYKMPDQGYEEFQFIHYPTPLFVHQYSHAFIDFRNKRDNFSIDYYENSVTATKATKQFFVKELSHIFESYSENFWGLTASDTPYGYDAWSVLPVNGHIDGGIVPCCAGGSIPFAPEDTIGVLKNLRENHTAQAWTRYGFVDAFNPMTGWTNEDVIGIDVGITMLMAENYRTGFVWNYFMQNPHIQAAMEKIGFQDYTP